MSSSEEKSSHLHRSGHCSAPCLGGMQCWDPLWKPCCSGCRAPGWTSVSPVPVALALPRKGCRTIVEEQILQQRGRRDDALAAAGARERWGLLSGLGLFHDSLWVLRRLIWCIFGFCLLAALRYGVKTPPWGTLA